MANLSSNGLCGPTAKTWNKINYGGFPPKYGAAVVLRRGVTPRRGQAASTAALRGLRNDAGGRMVLGSQVA